MKEVLKEIREIRTAIDGISVVMEIEEIRSRLDSLENTLTESAKEAVDEMTFEEIESESRIPKIWDDITENELMTTSENEEIRDKLSNIVEDEIGCFVFDKEITQHESSIADPDDMECYSIYPLDVKGDIDDYIKELDKKLVEIVEEEYEESKSELIATSERIKSVVDEVITNTDPFIIKNIKNGDHKWINYLLGAVMKELKKKGGVNDIKEVQEEIRRKLEVTYTT